LLNHTRKRLIFAQGHLQETSMLNHTWKRLPLLNHNWKRLPLLNHNWKRLNLTITKNWIKFWILDIQSEVFTIQYETEHTLFSRHLRILRYKQLKEFSKLLMFYFDVLHRVLALYMSVCIFFLFSKSLSLFIEDLWDVENLAVTSTCLALKLWFFTLDLLPDLIVVLWRTNFKSIPLQKEQCLQQY